MQKQFRQFLINDTRVFDGVQHAATIDIEPDPNMHRMAGLAQQYCIALLGVIFGVCHVLPALPLGVVTKCAQHRTQVVRVDRDLRQIAGKVATLHGKKQTPAVVGIWPTRAGHPREPDVLSGPARVRFTNI